MTAREPNLTARFSAATALANGSRGEARRRRGLAASLAEARGPPPASPPTPSLRRLSFPSEPLRPPEQLPRRSRSRMVRGARQPQQPRSRPPPGGRGWMEVGLGMGGGARERAPGQQPAVRHSKAETAGRGFRLVNSGSPLGAAERAAGGLHSPPDERGVWGKGADGETRALGRRGRTRAPGGGGRGMWVRRAWGSEGHCPGGGGEHGEGEAEGCAGLMRQTMSRRWWVVWGDGLWRVRIEDERRDLTEQGLGKADIRGSLGFGLIGNRA